ncbi:hypothetical protein ACFSUK_05270 [Sphingobium scionense]
MHRLVEIGYDRFEGRIGEIIDLPRDLEQSGIAHLEDFADHVCSVAPGYAVRCHARAATGTCPVAKKRFSYRGNPR